MILTDGITVTQQSTRFYPFRICVWDAACNDATWTTDPEFARELFEARIKEIMDANKRQKWKRGSVMLSSTLMGE